LLILLAADESLKFWKIFEKKSGASLSTTAGVASGKADMVKQMTIR
jgi:cell division cycle protein 20 (cofactor of APC complex)